MQATTSSRHAIRGLRALCVGVGLSLTFAAHAQNDRDQRAQIEAVQRTVMSSQLSGQIEALPYREGQSFEEGARLARIDCTLYNAEKDRVAAKYAAARRKRDSNEELARLQSVGKLELDLSKLDVQETLAELRSAQANASRCSVDAPFAGRVVRLFAREGQSVKAQDKLLEIVGSQLEARVIVPATWLAWLDKGARVEFEVAETGQRVAGTVERVGASVDPVSHTIPVWARLADSQSLRPGMTASARFPQRPRTDDGNEAAGDTPAAS
ncbi:efflux RND transporter periplasmic adaptor subunit [Salinisphaera sp. T31B1]|uniref:efflux RND transporter periplasmic adaptor subunit n=1 Tax=Salinisphaera sp. T31B1 TaxID=727963 RepID=UPI003341AFCA